MSIYPPDLELYVQQKIASGEFQSAEQFAAVAARLYRRLERRRDELKASIDAGLAELDAGDCAPLDIEAIKAELIAELDLNQA
ncbi:MAG: hypothetical protein K2Y37_00165 [Pirellulales bacterium]|nr:hypothetical protein [Pirellulales bacterium]